MAADRVGDDLEGEPVADPLRDGSVGRRFLVDAMNLLGSRPDGWWEERDAALVALADEVRAWAASTATPVTFVVDGRPFADLAAVSAPHFAVDFADRPGPDGADRRIVELVEQAPGVEVVVVTADRRLRNMARARGADLEGPVAFRRRLRGGVGRDDQRPPPDLGQDPGRGGPVGP